VQVSGSALALGSALAPVRVPGLAQVPVSAMALVSVTAPVWALGPVMASAPTRRFPEAHPRTRLRIRPSRRRRPEATQLEERVCGI